MASDIVYKAINELVFGFLQQNDSTIKNDQAVVIKLIKKYMELLLNYSDDLDLMTSWVNNLNLEYNDLLKNNFNSLHGLIKNLLLDEDPSKNILELLTKINVLFTEILQNVITIIKENFEIFKNNNPNKKVIETITPQKNLFLKNINTIDTHINNYFVRLKQNINKKRDDDKRRKMQTFICDNHNGYYLYYAGLFILLIVTIIVIHNIEIHNIETNY